ncbi:MAG: hypothetical protein MAG794_01220 [Gammaproteobacteria bacterium]|nr:hypothetical protein [Gammaproteobacteria bacterium]
MAGLHLSDEEQSERFKEWWKENGTSVIAGLVLGVAVIGGVNYWRTYTAERAESASALYAQLLENPDGSAAVDVGKRLINEYSSTPYAGRAALFMARAAFENGDMAEAKSHLEWALANSSDSTNRRLARLRLARLSLNLNELGEVETWLSGMQGGGYESEYRELRGDLAVARNDPKAARAEYKAALENLPERSAYADMLNIKLDAAIGASQ